MKKGVNLPNCCVRLENRKCSTTFENAEVFTKIFAQTSRTEVISPKCRITGKMKISIICTKIRPKTINIMLMFQLLNDAIAWLDSKKSSVGLHYRYPIKRDAEASARFLFLFFYMIFFKNIR